MIFSQDFFPGVRKLGSQFAEDCYEIELWTISPKTNQLKIQIFTQAMIHLNGLSCPSTEEEILNTVQLRNISEYLFR